MGSISLRRLGVLAPHPLFANLNTVIGPGDRAFWPLRLPLPFASCHAPPFAAIKRPHREMAREVRE